MALQAFFLVTALDTSPLTCKLNITNYYYWIIFKAF